MLQRPSPGPAPRQPAAEPTAPPPSHCETWTDPATGLKMNRLSLGCCLSGRLRTRPLWKSTGIDVLWIGNNAAGAFDYYLRQTIADSWQRLKMITD
jgi:hypothetical protein